VLAQVQRRADEADRYFPLSLGSGGQLPDRRQSLDQRRGVNVLRYGMMRDLVLGLEVVLADGRVLPALSALRKDNTGYDVRSLFLGAEAPLASSCRQPQAVPQDPRPRHGRSPPSPRCARRLSCSRGCATPAAIGEFLRTHPAHRD